MNCWPSLRSISRWTTSSSAGSFGEFIDDDVPGFLISLDKTDEILGLDGILTQDRGVEQIHAQSVGILILAPRSLAGPPGRGGRSAPCRQSTGVG